MTKFNVGSIGDKVRILDGQALIGNHRYKVTTGKEYEILSFHEKTETAVEHIKIFDNHSNPFSICDYEYKYIELVEKKLTKNERITVLEDTVAKQSEEISELKLIVHELRGKKPMEPSTTVGDIIEFEGDKYRKVDREAQVGDVVIFRNQTNNHIPKNNTPYLMDIDDDECIVIGTDECCVYSEIHNRTLETVDVYELIESKSLTPNQQRAEIIEKAKKFVDEHKSKYRTEWNIVGHTVQILIYDSNGMLMMFRQANCNPNDVFNEHIGKAIALGRALGLDVSEFEQAVQPNEIVLGHIIVWNEVLDEPHKVVERNGDWFDFVNLKNNKNYNNFEYCEIEEVTTIINDTNAKY
ncbi:hypothetical protein [Lysinibacillus sp. NPDC047702]|uniref:hypothetical protein n=1 Tax=unclassified Lysinibacillus TaxID=2636778 RepID=UPI003D018804